MDLDDALDDSGMSEISMRFALRQAVFWFRQVHAIQEYPSVDHRRKERKLSTNTPQRCDI